MLNKQQREFRRNMKQTQDNKLRMGMDEPLSYRESNYRPRSYRKPLIVGGSGVGLLILLWNIYALSTWIHPQRLISTITGRSVAPSNSSLSLIGGTVGQQVNDYIQTSAAIEQQLTSLLKPFLDPNTLNSIPTQMLSTAQSQLNRMHQTALTNLDVLSPLQNYNLKQIGLMQSVLNDIMAYRNTHNPSDWQAVQQLLGQYNQNLATQQTIVISILQQAHMPYQIDANGHITYQYTRSSK